MFVFGNTACQRVVLCWEVCTFHESALQKLRDLHSDRIREDIRSTRFLVLMTVTMNPQKYWVSGLCPLSRILNTRKHDVLETASVSVQ
jgi:hypothetical protein